MALVKRGKKEEEERILDIDANMQGNLIFKDPVKIRIQGSFDGKLDTRGILMIGEKADVKADIIGETILIFGKVSGTVVANHELKLMAPSRVNGEIKTPLLEIEQGAVLNGTCQMTAEPDKKFNKAVLTLDEVSRYLSIDAASLSNWAEQGKIPGFKESNAWKFEKAKIDDWIAAGKV